MAQPQVRIIFQDGVVFSGRAFTESDDRYAEVVFTTSMTGYQEILTDPSYKGQAVVMTYPLIGNYGINNEDGESQRVYLEALLVKEYCRHPSNWRSTKTLQNFLVEQRVLGVEGIDTRALTRYLREKGSSVAAITSLGGAVEMYAQRTREAQTLLKDTMSYENSCEARSLRISGAPRPFRVAVLDCGSKQSIVRLLEAYQCCCSVFSSSSSLAHLLAGTFHGVVISNGPGNPEWATQVTELVRQLIGKIPLFGICLGHQIIAQALGARTFKLPFGHHGSNHPVLNLATGRVEITSQNHNYAVDPDSLGADLEVTHRHLNDGTIAGIRHRRLPIMAVQFHPEAAPGPHDSRYLFAEFSSHLSAGT